MQVSSGFGQTLLSRSLHSSMSLEQFGDVQPCEHTQPPVIESQDSVLPGTHEQVKRQSLPKATLLQAAKIFQHRRTICYTIQKQSIQINYFGY